MWKAEAPSNIALIKYMGKTQTQGNRPTNPSLSYTLPHLKSYVTIEILNSDAPLSLVWQPIEGMESLQLSEAGKGKFLGHIEKLFKLWEISGSYQVKSGNDFPAACGLASSASSFAAATLCAAKVLEEKRGLKLDALQLSQLSQGGSGSSCRSFFNEWSIWEDHGARGLEFPVRDLVHDVVIVDSSEKLVSSSQAHQRVLTSSLFEGREIRAKTRLVQLITGLKASDWPAIYEVCWAEFWDMHALFETSAPSFGYMTAGSLEVLNLTRNIWRGGDGPIVTMDAGPNVHLLWRRDQADLRSQVLKLISTRVYSQ